MERYFSRGGRQGGADALRSPNLRCTWELVSKQPAGRAQRLPEQPRGGFSGFG